MPLIPEGVSECSFKHIHCVIPKSWFLYPLVFQAYNNTIKRSPLYNFKVKSFWKFQTGNLCTSNDFRTLWHLAGWLSPVYSCPVKGRHWGARCVELLWLTLVPWQCLKPGGSSTKSVPLRVWKLLFLGSSSGLYRGGAKVRCLQRLCQKQFTPNLQRTPFRFGPITTPRRLLVKPLLEKSCWEQAW